MQLMLLNYLIYYYLKTVLEIQNMMHCFGDSPQSLKETVELVEIIVKEQLNHFFELLCETAINRDSKKIGVKEFLILLR